MGERDSNTGGTSCTRTRRINIFAYEYVCVCVCISMYMLPEIFISFIQFIVFQWKGKAKVHNVPQFLCLISALSIASHSHSLCLSPSLSGYLSLPLSRIVALCFAFAFQKQLFNSARALNVPFWVPVHA